jgi:hypothetical protein
MTVGSPRRLMVVAASQLATARSEQAALDGVGVAAFKQLSANKLAE